MASHLCYTCLYNIKLVELNGLLSPLVCAGPFPCLCSLNHLEMGLLIDFFLSPYTIQAKPTMKIVACLLALVAVAAARSAYQFSDGYLDILGGEPNQAFDCAGRAYGYYADVANDCRIFHICLPIPDDAGEIVETAQFSFFCGNQTVFSQESLTCAHPQEALPCSEAEGFFDLSNADFGRIPDESK